MAVVHVHLSVFDLRFLSDRVEITEHETDVGATGSLPVFESDLTSLDFAAVRVGFDLYHMVKSRKPLATTMLFPAKGGTTGVLIHGSRARIRPVDYGGAGVLEEDL